MTVIVESTKPMAVMKHTLFSEPGMRLKHEVMKKGLAGRLEVGITPGKDTMSRCQTGNPMMLWQTQRLIWKVQGEITMESILGWWHH